MDNYCDWLWCYVCMRPRHTMPAAACSEVTYCMVHSCMPTCHVCVFLGQCVCMCPNMSKAMHLYVKCIVYACRWRCMWVCAHAGHAGMWECSSGLYTCSPCLANYHKQHERKQTTGLPGMCVLCLQLHAWPRSVKQEQEYFSHAIATGNRANHRFKTRLILIVTLRTFPVSYITRITERTPHITRLYTHW